MILCRWKAEWCIAQRAQANLPGCSLAVPNSRGPRLAGPGFREYVYKTFWHKYVDAIEEIVFYAEIRYKGMRVTPIMWHPESEEPLLRCLAGQSADDYPPGAGDEFIEMLRADGWHIQRCETWGYVHVDELEKIEGPPPEGPF